MPETPAKRFPFKDLVSRFSRTTNLFTVMSVALNINVRFNIQF